MSGVRAPSGIKTRTWPYDRFRGLDSSRDITVLDTGKDQHLYVLNNAHCDWRGQIVRDSPALFVDGDLPVTHVNFYDQDRLIWCEEDGDGTHIRTSAGHELRSAFASGATISSAVFNRKVHLCARGALMRKYDGAKFEETESVSMRLIRPSFITTIGRRLAAAGIPGFETEVHISRVDNADVMPGDEADGEVSVLRAGIIDIANLIGTADRITGLAVYEQSRLVIFTDDRAVVYRIDPDIDQWVLDESVNIRVGCISHNTIRNAGSDILFCSRHGVHSIRRSEQNGILVDTYTLSDKIDLLYRQLYNGVIEKTKISAVYEQDTGQYHIFFPQTGGTRRLTLTISPETEEGAPPSFSTGDFLNANCGSFLAGKLVFGTPGGVYHVLHEEDEADYSISPESVIETPFLWHGSIHEEKMTRSLIIQASGKGVIEVEAIDLNGRIIDSLHIEIQPEADDTAQYNVPLSRQYERPWEHRYLAARYRFRIKKSAGLIRISGFAVKTRSN